MDEAHIKIIQKNTILELYLHIIKDEELWLTDSDILLSYISKYYDNVK